MIRYNKMLAGALAMMSFFTVPLGNFVFTDGESTELVAQEIIQKSRDGDESIPEEDIKEEDIKEEDLSEVPKEDIAEEDTTQEDMTEVDASDEETDDELFEEEGTQKAEGKDSSEETESAGEVIREDGDSFVERVILLDSEGNEVTGGMSLSKRYRLRYELISPLQIQLNTGDVMRPPYMEKGKTYLLPGITDDFMNFTGSITVKASDSDGNMVTVATVEIGDDGIPVFIVDADLDKGSVLDSYFEIEISLNQEKIGDSEDYIFTLPKGGSAQAEIEENKKLPPDIEKEAVFYDRGSHTITWRIRVENPVKPKDNLYPLKFTDVIEEGQTYVENSFRVTEPEGLIPEEFEISGNQMTWQYSDETGNAGIQYEYQTRVDILALLESNITNDDIEVSARNILSVAGEDGSRVVDDIIAFQPITGKTPVTIEKTGEQIQYNETEDTGEIEWTIIITANGYALSNLTVYDYFEAGAAKVSLKGEPACNPLPTGGRGYDSSQGITNGKRYQWSYHIGDVSEKETYTITYTSVIENYSEYLKKNNEIHPRNEAWFDFYHPMDDGISLKEFHGGVTTAFAKGVSANIIDKTGAYNPSTHQITWTIVVNPNQTELLNAEITDKIPEGQRYVPPAVMEPNDIPFTTVEDKSNNTVTFSFGKEGLSGRTTVITLITELEDDEAYKWANNWSGILENSVTLKADSLPRDGVADVGRVSAKCMVIEKELGDFDYAAHTIPVTVTINHNNMRLTGAVVTDRLSEYGLKLVTEKGVQIDGISLREGTDESRPSYRYDGSTLVIYPQEVLTGRANITFTVQASDEYMYACRTDTVIEFNNIATLTSDQYGEGTDAEDSATMRNRPVVKNGMLHPETGIISYTVEFNRTLAFLPNNLILTDTLPAGLLLKQSTVKLWKARVDSDSGVMSKTEKEAVGYDVKVSASEDNIVMQVFLPGGKQAYILEYDVQIVDKDKAPFVNRVDVSGYPGGGEESSTSFGRTQIAGARLENLIYIKVKKVDNFDMPLAGAVFALKQGDDLILVGCTGEDGYITFAGVSPNTEYTIEELQTPKGYMGNSEEWTFTTGTKGGVEYALERIFVNQEASDEQESVPGSSDNGSNSNGSSGSVSTSDSVTENIDSESFDVSEYPANVETLLPSDNHESFGMMTGLPKTGGFWGSGIMYIIGAVLAAVGFIVIAGTLFMNVYARQRSVGEIAAFEARLGLKELTGKNFTNAGEEEVSSMPVQELADENGVIAVLSIPSISCKEVVKEGSNRGILAKALGHMEGTAFPGRMGNCVIAGHRNYNFGLYFNRLNEVVKGDEITLTTREKVYTYTVTEIKVVEPKEISILEQTEDTRLTLITCTPIYIATHRLIVVAQLNSME